MPDKLIPLSKIADIIGGYAFKSGDFGAAGFPVVKIANIEPPAVNLGNCEKISPQKVLGLDKFRLCDRDIVMAMTEQRLESWANSFKRDVISQSASR